jgi:hypothetical protein
VNCAYVYSGYSRRYNGWSRFPLREQVREANETRLRRLDGEFLTFEASDVAGFDIYNRPVSMNKAKQLLDRLIAPEINKLKVPFLHMNNAIR